MQVFDVASSASSEEIVDLTTRTTRTSDAADHSYIFKPHTDLALANTLAY